MAKSTRAPLSLSTLSSARPSAAPPAPEPIEDRPQVGRPRSLPENVRSMTLRLSDETHMALNVMAAQRRTTAKAILLAGLADQFAKAGIVVKVE